jgi:hypothetical protein
MTNGGMIGPRNNIIPYRTSGLYDLSEQYSASKSGNWERSIVRDGLVLWLEASHPDSYPGSGNTWYDLSGNNKNFTFYNSPAYSITNSAYLDFDGNNQYAESPSIIMTSPQSMSFFAWIYPKSDGQILTILGQQAINAAYHHSSIEVDSSGLLKMSLWHGGLTNRVTTILPSFNSWYYVGYTYAGTTLTGYLNGVSVGSTTFTWSPPANMYFGLMAIDTTSMGTAEYGDSRMSSLKTYSRAINSNEIQQNFSAAKSRYGL